MPNPHEPFRCFDGNAKPHEPFWKWVNVDSPMPEMELDGVISEYSWLDDDITPKMFKEDLYLYGKGGPVLVKINSPGGDVIAASKMRAIMTEYPGDITVRVEGIAASAAVIVAISASQVQMTDASYMMIHDPAVVVFLAMLDIETLGRLQDNLKTIKDGIIPSYAAKTGLSEGVISNMMTRETWMSAREAVDFGFADQVIAGGQKAKNQITNLTYVNVLKSYAHVPTALNAAMGMMTVQDCMEACESALSFCVDCLHQCETCPNAADPVHQACMAACRDCIERCAVCAHDCEDGMMTSQLMAACQDCMDACAACETACRNCAASCQVCNAACTVCGDACQLCGTVCSQMAGMAGDMQPSAQNKVNVLSARSSSETRQADKEREAQALREHVQLYK